MKKYEIRDPVHKRITFNHFEKSIIDHPYLQRLRFISQLGFIQTYVYPGGLHDRFTHALGAMHVAGRLFGIVVGGSEELTSRLSTDEINALRLRVRIAALLHDIGHGPFSHASESVFPRLEALPLEWSWWKSKPQRQAKHEDYSVLLIQALSDQGMFSKGFAEDVASLVHDNIRPSEFFELLEQKAPTLQKILKALISGEVDCDRMDYLLRDSYYCGVAYGHYDIDWLISSMSVTENDDHLIFTISENGVRAFEDMLLARYHMIDQVYFHKTAAGFTHYLEEAIRTKEIPLEIPVNPIEYVELRDGKIIEMMFKAAENPQNYWSHHLMNRIPPKRILRLHQSKFEDTKTLRELEELCQKHGIRYFTHSVANQLSHFGEGTDAASMIYVTKKTMSGIDYIPIFQYSDLLKKYNEKIRFTDFFVLREDYEKYKKII